MLWNLNGEPFYYGLYYSRVIFRAMRCWIQGYGRFIRSVTGYLIPARVALRFLKNNVVVILVDRNCSRNSWVVETCSKPRLTDLSMTNQSIRISGLFRIMKNGGHSTLMSQSLIMMRSVHPVKHMKIRRGLVITENLSLQPIHIRNWMMNISPLRAHTHNTINEMPTSLI